MNKKVTSGFMAALIAAAVPSAAVAMDFKGRVSESVFMQNDDASNQTYNFTRTRLYLNGLGEETDFHFDGQYRTTAGKDYNSKIGNTRIDLLNVDMRHVGGGNTRLTMGRQYIDSMPGAKVDGLNADFTMGESTGTGIFGGTKAEPQQDYFTTDYTTYGLYAYLRQKGFSTSLGLASSQHKGTEDEMYLYGSLAWSPTDSMSLYSSLRVDNKVTGDASGGKEGPDITNLFVNFNYRWGWTARINATYSQYRAIWLQDTMSYGIDHNINRNYGLYGDYSITRSGKVYADINYATRGNDGKDGSVMGIGYRQNDLLNVLYGNVAYRMVNYYTNKGWQGFAALGADVRENVSAELNTTYMST
ncbi:MAG: hypothetical protein EPO63_08440, partial [Candidatus Nitrosotenuis sp.]